MRPLATFIALYAVLEAAGIACFWYAARADAKYREGRGGDAATIAGAVFCALGPIAAFVIAHY